MAKVALLVGVSKFKDPTLEPLPKASADVDAVKQVLLDPEMGDFAESNITVLKNPSKQDLDDEIYELFNDRKKDDLLLFYFSGHGIIDGSGMFYFSTTSTLKEKNGSLRPTTAVPSVDVHNRMKDSPSKQQVIILDCCFSGAFVKGMTAKGAATVNITQQFGGEGRAILTAASASQYAWAKEGYDLSAYTYYLLEGIQTGEADQDGDDRLSIEELHAYVSRRVKESGLEMTPEFYPVRQGYKIRPFKARITDPKQKYQKAVQPYTNQGKISEVGRVRLNRLSDQLGLSQAEALAIEENVFAPYKRKQENLKIYQQTLTKVLSKEGTLSSDTLEELKALQQDLQLPNEVVELIPQKIEENLKIYQKILTDALTQEGTPSSETLEELKVVQQNLELPDEAVKLIWQKISAEFTANSKAYQQKLAQYQQAFVDATQQEFPLSEAKYNELRQQQHRLGLRDEDVATVEAQVEAYQQKQQQYEQAFAHATQRKHYLRAATRNQLRQTSQDLGLKAEDAAAIEARITAQIESHQRKLSQYEQELAKATQQQYPLSKIKQQDLRLLQQLLQLTDEDVSPIHDQITSLSEQQKQKAQPVQGKKLDEVTSIQERSPAEKSLVSTANQPKNQNQIFTRVSATISNKFRLLIGVSIAAATSFFLIPTTIHLLQNSSSKVDFISPNLNEQIERDHRILAEAKSLADQKNLEWAIQKTEQIEANSPIYEEARKQALSWQLQALSWQLQQYLQNVFPQQDETLKVLITSKIEVVQVDTDRVTIKLVSGNSKVDDDKLKELTYMYMLALRGNVELGANQENMIFPKYTNFTQITVYQEKKKATLTLNYWQDYIRGHTKFDKLLEQIQITN